MTIEKSTYDDSPYESMPFAYTSPEHLRAIGLIFGMNPPALETARVLELGSAAGGNIVCFASNYPKSHSVGVDLSSVQINEGKEFIKSLGLKNIDLKAISITDIDDSFGQFDYIICHGVYSWVQDSVKEKILEISKKNLSPNGIAYVSYNTLPGWNSQATIKGMMQFHSAMFGTVIDKVQQAKLFLNFVADALEGSNTPHERFLKQEAQMAAHYNESYLRHEYLEGVNDPCYFHEFMQRAQGQGLMYLGDTHLSSMFLGNLAATAQEKLAGIGDIVRTEQYMDFISNRRFRATLLCHNNVALNRNITPQSLDGLFFAMNLVPEKSLQYVDFNKNENLTFYINGNKDSALGVSTPTMKAVCAAFIENQGLLSSFDTIAKIALTKISGVTLEAIRAEMGINLLNLIFKGMIKVTAAPAKAISSQSDKPKVTELVRKQAEAKKSLWVTNQINECVAVNLVERIALCYMDGKHTKAQIVDKLINDHLSKGEIALNVDGKPITDSAVIKSTIEGVIDQCLEKYRVSYMFVE